MHAPFKHAPIGKDALDRAKDVQLVRTMLGYIHTSYSPRPSSMFAARPLYPIRLDEAQKTSDRKLGPSSAFRGSALLVLSVPLFCSPVPIFHESGPAAMSL